MNPEATFEDHRHQVYAWAYRLLQNHHDALDVTQDVFIKWWRAHTTKDKPANAIGWLRRVTVNQAIDVIRAAGGRATQPANDNRAAAESSDELASRETALSVARALEALTDRQRAAVIAKVYDNCTFARIAEQMGLSVPTVKTHYLRGLQALRLKLPTPGNDRPRATEDRHEL